MTVTTAKWTLDDYHRMIEVGILEGRHVELLNGEIIKVLRNPINGDYADEITLSEGEVSPLAFPEIKVLVRRLFS